MPIFNKQPIIRIIPFSNEDNFIDIRKFTKILPDSLIFTNKKNTTINKWLSKIQNKFRINWNHYLTNKSKLIYTENKIRKKTL